MAECTSVIIPYYNHGEHLQAAVQSALAAAGRTGDVEIIIVDDGSKELGKATFLKNALRLSKTVKLIEKENGGLSSARNAGLVEAMGEYIQLLDSDDLLLADKFALQQAHLVCNPEALASICHYAMCDKWAAHFQMDYDSIGRFDLSPENFLFMWERGFSVPIHTALFRRSVFDKLRFSTDVEGKEDWIFWCSLLRNDRHALAYIPFLGAVYRLHGESMTRSMERMGRAFEIAVEKIALLWWDEFPHFLAASHQWLARFYRVGAGRERMAHSVLAPVVSCSQLPVDLIKSSPISTSRPTYIRDTLGVPGNIDVIVPVYNHFEYLKGCLESVLSQPELGRCICIDDCSPDPRIWPFLEALAQKSDRLVAIRNSQNLGISNSQNIALEHCLAEYVAFVDCDDEIEPGALTVIRSEIKLSNADYLFSDRLDIDNEGKVIRHAMYGGYDWIKSGGNIEIDLVKGMVASHLKVIRRKLMIDLGGYDPNFTGIQDWEFALRCLNRAIFRYVPQALYRHRVHLGSVSNSHRVAQMWLTNCARRNLIEGKRKLRGGGGGKQVRVTELSSFSAAVDVLERVVYGHEAIFLGAGRDIDISELNLLREFNGLFDIIEIDQNNAPSLYGYLWSAHILKSGMG